MGHVVRDVVVVLFRQALKLLHSADEYLEEFDLHICICGLGSIKFERFSEELLYKKTAT